MQLLVPLLFIANIIGLSSACTQKRIGYQSKREACELDAGSWRNKCNDLTYKYYDYSSKNQNRLGHDITADAYCDPCSQKGGKCYCIVSFWRFREWMGDIPHIQNADWDFDGSEPVSISSKRIDCD